MRLFIAWVVFMITLITLAIMSRDPEPENVVSADSVKQMCGAPDSKVTVTIVKSTWYASTTLTCEAPFGDSERTGMEDDRG